MDIHYNAFISYRHHPQDIRVASEIHRLLERFRIPRGLRGKTQEIRRIFRDKEELPITSNLTEDITAALRNSDYLIVICSEHTRESVWVQREIETFLRTHSRSRVLTVLCGGEPQDVIPEILLYEDVTDPVTGETVRKDVEPLSCDWRLPAKQARREELPRLAAALMGCGYDDLRQRQRHYRMQRLIGIMAAAAALSLGFAGYFLYNSITIQRANVQIQANLEEALRNQSRFLANAARERLDDGDRLTAIALAMEALPEYDGERPYVTDAEYVLSNALGIYDKENIMAVGAMGRGENTLIREFWVSQEEPVAVIHDGRGVITTWNTRTMEKIATLPLEAAWVEELAFTRQGTIVALINSPENSVYAMSPEGTLLWKRNSCVDMKYLPDNTLLLFCGMGETKELLYVDPQTGSELCPRVNTAIPGSENQPSGILDGGSGMGGRVVLSCWDYEGTDIAVLEPGAGEPVTILKAVPSYSAYLLTEDGKLLLMHSRDPRSMLGMYMSGRVTGDLQYDIVCYDIQDGSLLWESQMQVYSYTGTNLMERIPDSDNVLCVSGNVLQILDLNTGEQLSHCETGNGILSVEVGREKALMALQDGYYASYVYGENRCYELSCMQDQLSQALVRSGDGLYGLQENGLQVTVYRVVEGERVWKSELGEDVYVNYERIHGDRLAFLNSRDLYLFDYARQELLWERDIGYAKMLDFSADGSRIWMVQNTTQLVTVFTEDGSTTTMDFPQEWDGRTCYPGYSTGYILEKDCLYYMASNSDEARLVCWDLNTDTTRTLPLPRGVFPKGDFMADTKLMWYSDDHVWFVIDGRLYAMDLRDGAIHLVLKGLEETPRLLSREGQRVFLSVGDQLYGFDGREPMITISLENTRGCSAFSREEDLFVLCDNARVYRYDYAGTKLGELEVEIYNTFASKAGERDLYIPGWYVTRDNRILVNALGVVTLIDWENWGVCAGIADVVGFIPEEDMLLLSSRGTLSGCPLYSTEELQQIAREQLNGFTLSEKELRYYGIE